MMLLKPKLTFSFLSTSSVRQYSLVKLITNQTAALIESLRRQTNVTMNDNCNIVHQLKVADDSLKIKTNAEGKSTCCGGGGLGVGDWG